MTPRPRRHVRGEQGHTDGRFLRKLTMVCFISLALSGLIVCMIGEITPPQPGGRPPTAQPSHRSEPRPSAGATTPAGQRLTPAPCGG